MLRGFFLLQSAFMVWMLVDAIQRGAVYYWYFIIVGLPPFGPWIYFFSVKIHDYDMRRFTALFHRPPSVEQLRYNLSENPCLENKILLAIGLYNSNAYDEAADLFGQVLKVDALDKEALYGLGLCKIKAGDFQGAVEYLKKVIDVDKAFRDYAPWADLAHALWMDGQKEETIIQLRELVETSPRTNHMTMLAHYLIQSDRKEEARTVLKKALEDYAHAPRFVKRTYGRWAKEAKAVLKSLSDEK
jgi:hypothetical protein